MGKLSSLSSWLEGTRAIKRVPLPLVNVPSEYSEDQPELVAQREKNRVQADESTPPGSDPAGAFRVPVVGVRVMTGLEQAEVYRRARAYSKDNGGNPETPTDALYNFATAAYTVAISCVDPDSNPKDPEPFFGSKGDTESGFLELLSSPYIGRDGIVFLHEAQELWQDESSPQALKIDAAKFLQLVEEVATSNDASPFLRLRRGAQAKFTQLLAAHWLSSQMRSSPSSSGSETQSAGPS